MNKSHSAERQNHKGQPCQPAKPPAKGQDTHVLNAESQDSQCQEGEVATDTERLPQEKGDLSTHHPPPSGVHAFPQTESQLPGPALSLLQCKFTSLEMANDHRASEPESGWAHHLPLLRGTTSRDQREREHPGSFLAKKEETNKPITQTLCYAHRLQQSREVIPRTGSLEKRSSRHFFK